MDTIMERELIDEGNGLYHEALDIAVFLNGILHSRVQEVELLNSDNSFSMDKLLIHAGKVLRRELEMFTLISTAAPDGYGIFIVSEPERGTVTYDWGK